MYTKSCISDFSDLLNVKQILIIADHRYWRCRCRRDSMKEGFSGGRNRWSSGPQEACIARTCRGGLGVRRAISLAGFCLLIEVSDGSAAERIPRFLQAYLRVAEITKMDMKVENGRVTAFRACNTPLHWTCARTTLTRPLARSPPAADCA